MCGYRVSRRGCLSPFPPRLERSGSQACTVCLYSFCGLFFSFFFSQQFIFKCASPLCLFVRVYVRAHACTCMSAIGDQMPLGLQLEMAMNLLTQCRVVNLVLWKSCLHSSGEPSLHLLLRSCIYYLGVFLWTPEMSSLCLSFL